MQRSLFTYLKNVRKESYLDTEYIVADGSIYELPFPIEASEGDHSLESCEECRKNHNTILKEIEDRFEIFPKCCEYHEPLLELSEFKKEDFDGAPKHVADKILFTYHHIINHLEDDGWYNEITDYLEYAYRSFGQMPTGCGEPFQRNRFVTTIEDMLKHFAKDYSGKLELKDALTRMNKVQNLLNPEKFGFDTEERNFDTMLNTYKEWVELFPFELSYFTHLKSKFRKIIPFHSGKSRFNQYLKEVILEMHTQESLSSGLITITQKLLQAVSGAILFERDELSDADHKYIELIVGRRKMEIKELSESPNKKRSEYLKLIKKWFRDEKRFINDITPVLQTLESSKKNKRPYSSDVAYAVYYQEYTDTLETKNQFPSEDAWKEIAEGYGKHWKNSQMVYNAIIKDEVERLQPSRRKNIEYVITHMLSDKQEAKLLAEDELNLINLKS